MFDEIRTLFTEMLDINNRTAELAQSDAPDLAREMLGLRKRYSDLSFRAAAMVDTDICTAYGDHEPARETIREYRQRNADLRRALADHHAKWPTSLIGQDPEGYNEDGRKLCLLQTATLEWVLAAFLPEMSRLAQTRPKAATG
ncbi:hypothetical protein [Parasphingopyxis marina]|uniref:Uncharacterized protein n=1 Tax=Parasphingopyxis marina TaxID=2761622 RepID=A0A842HTF4_9SPHN|nr:hypothetical protein [Parasphingopyxis marina]MBC2776366.1 hypothetical protein [Parasphingopyxis marina]